jgi:DNA-binding LytR/AlgR family response regulator
MKIAICDDFLLDAQHLYDICMESDLLNESTIDIFTSAQSLLSLYERNSQCFDLLFLDVDMPQITGIELGKTIKTLSPRTIIVFTTNYPQFAIDAFDCEAFHYILKPCCKEKVYYVLDKVFSKYQLTHKYHIVKVKNQTYKIPINDIYYIECCRKHVIYHLKNKTIETVDKLSSAYNALSDFGFYQIHQGYIINFDKVYEFKDYSVVLEDKRTVMMSVRKKREVLLAYAKYTERFI